LCVQSAGVPVASQRRREVQRDRAIETERERDRERVRARARERERGENTRECVCIQSADVPAAGRRRQGTEKVSEREREGDRR